MFLSDGALVTWWEEVRNLPLGIFSLPDANPPPAFPFATHPEEIQDRSPREEWFALTVPPSPTPGASPDASCPCKKLSGEQILNLASSGFGRQDASLSAVTGWRCAGTACPSARSGPVTTAFQAHRGAAALAPEESAPASLCSKDALGGWSAGLVPVQRFNRKPQAQSP